MTADTPQWAAIVKPGDTLVLSYAQRLNYAELDELDELHARLALWLDPLDVKALIVTGASGMEVVRSDEDAPPAPSSSPQSAENGSLVGRDTPGQPQADSEPCGNCGLPVADCPETGWGDYPLTETYPGSGIYE